MADLIKKIKIKKQDGTFTDYIPIGAEAQNVNMQNESSVQANIGNIDLENDGNIDQQLKKIKQQNLKYHLYQPYLSTSEELGCFNVLSFENGFNILCDCGLAGQENVIDAYLASKNIDYFNIVIVTHFHGDHAGCFEHIARNYCDSNTKFFRQMEWDGTRLSDGKQLETNYINILTSLGYINNSRVPNQNETVLVNNDLVKLRFLNTDATFLEGYYTSHSDTNLTNYLNPSLNNFSLICEVSCGNQTILWTGDVEQLAQKNNYSFIRKVDILQIPHHNWNKNGYYKFFQNASPTIGYYNRNTYANFFNSYWHRYQRQCSGYVPTYYTYNANHVEFSLDNSGIKIESGFQDDRYNINYTDDTILADLPSYEDDVHDYWTYPSWKIDDVISLVSYFRNKGKQWRYVLGSAMTEFNTEIKAITGETNDSLYFYLSLLDRGFQLHRGRCWANRQYTFLQGFQYNDTSTWGDTLIDSTIPFNNHNKNENLSATTASGKVTLSNVLRKPQSIFVAVDFNGTTYYKVLHNTPTTTGATLNAEYEVIETKVTASTIETINVHIEMAGDYLKVKTCEQNIYDTTNSTTTTYSGTITECSGCAFN